MAHMGLCQLVIVGVRQVLCRIGRECQAGCTAVRHFGRSPGGPRRKLYVEEREVSVGGGRIISLVDVPRGIDSR